MGGFAFVPIVHKVSPPAVCVDSALLLFAIAPFLSEPLMSSLSVGHAALSLIRPGDFAFSNAGRVPRVE